MKRTKNYLLNTFLALLLICSFSGCLSTGVSEQEKIQALEVGSPLIITSFWTGLPNSVGGVDLHISYDYISDKEAKYIYFTVTPYNAVNDIVSREIGNKTTAHCKITGPVKKGRDYGRYSCVWYNNTIEYAKLNMIEIEYMDGTKTSISDPDIIGSYILKTK